MHLYCVHPFPTPELFVRTDHAVIILGLDRSPALRGSA